MITCLHDNHSWHAFSPSTCGFRQQHPAICLACCMFRAEYGCLSGMQVPQTRLWVPDMSKLTPAAGAMICHSTVCNGTLGIMCCQIDANQSCCRATAGNLSAYRWVVAVMATSRSLLLSAVGCKSAPPGLETKYSKYTRKQVRTAANSATNLIWIGLLRETFLV